MTSPSSGARAEIGHEVGGQLTEVHGRESRGHRPRLIAQGAGITIHGHDPAGRAEEVGEREGERAGPRTEVRPEGAIRPGRVHGTAQQRDMVGVIHRRDSTSRVPGTGARRW